MKNIVHNIDNMEFMKDIPVNYYDLAIVDPPYGIGASGQMGGTNCKRWNSPKEKIYHNGNWDNKIPDPEYFHEIVRISKNQIIWGSNYFILNPTPCFIVWDKKRSGNYAECEIAYTSFNSPSKIFTWLWNGFQKQKPENRIHPTQKPVFLYKWLLQNYAKPGYKIFDSHVGSGSIRIACHDMGFEFEGCELDQYYWQAQEERYKNHISQGDLFGTDEIQGLIFNG